MHEWVRASMRTVSNVYIHDLHANAHLWSACKCTSKCRPVLPVPHTRTCGVHMQSTPTCCSTTISHTHTTRTPSGKAQLARNWGTGCMQKERDVPSRRCTKLMPFESPCRALFRLSRYCIRATQSVVRPSHSHHLSAVFHVPIATFLRVCMYMYVYAIILICYERHWQRQIGTCTQVLNFLACLYVCMYVRISMYRYPYIYPLDSSVNNKTVTISRDEIDMVWTGCIRI